MTSETFTAKIMLVDKPTSQGRIYPRSVCEAVVKQINDRAFNFGEAEVGEGASINMAQVSHTIEKARIEGDYVVADVRVLPTEMGKVVEPIAHTLNYAPRGFGQVSDEGVISDYTLVCVDCTARPVTHLTDEENNRYQNFLISVKE